MGSTAQSTCLQSEGKLDENISMATHSDRFGLLLTEHKVQETYLPL